MMQCAPRVSPDGIDLQINQRVLQVKTLKANFFRFQTIGAQLACWLWDDWRCRRLACGDSHHRNKLMS
jgi:hypothetical protein